MEAAELQSRLKKLPAGALLETRKFGRSSSLSAWVELKTVVDCARFLREDSRLALDWLENLSVMQLDEAFVVSYFLRSSADPSTTLILRASAVPPSPEAPLQVASVRDIWPMAEPFEAEASDLFGIDFLGARSMPSTTSFRRLPDGWIGYPLRKGYVFPERVGSIAHRESRPALERPAGSQSDERAEALDESDMTRGLE